MQYDRSARCVHCHRYHIVRATKYRHRVLVGDLRLRVRAVSDPVGGMKGRSSHRVRRGFPEIRRRYRGRRFWGRGYFPATTGAITDEPVLQYLDSHLPDATGASG